MKHINKLTAVIVFLFSSQAFAFGTFLNSSSLLSGSEYDISGVTQFFAKDRNGLHALGMIDLPFSEQTNLRFYGGIGSFDFSLGANIKWIATELNRKNDFNFGAVAASEYGRDGGNDFFSFRISPFVSKNLSWDDGTFEPYAALPLGLISADSNSKLSSLFVIGSKVKFDSLSYMSFSAEGGFDIKNAESYFAFMATILLRK